MLKLSPEKKQLLGVACAVVGNTKLVYLDEPTLNLSPHATRLVWELLTAEKAGRVILMTTQNANEADTLADKKVIMVAGKVMFDGSSQYLRKKFCKFVFFCNFLFYLRRCILSRFVVQFENKIHHN